MILHWFTTGWRSLVANPLFSLITIISLSIGCCGALLVGANLKQHLSFDKWVPDGEHIFLVTRIQDMSAMMGPGVRFEGAGMRRPQASAPIAMADTVKSQAGVETVARMVRGASLLPPDPSLPTTPPQPGDPPRTPPPGSVYVDPDFFEMFGLEFVEGAAEAINEPSGVVITETAARRLFGNGPAMGQTVEGASKRQFRVTGVIRDLPVATHLRFEALGSIRLYQQIVESDQAAQNGGASPPPRTFDNWNTGPAGALYVRSTPDIAPRTFAAGLKTSVQAMVDERTKDPGSMTGPNGMTMRMPTMKYIYNAVPLLDIHLGGPDLTGLPSTGDATLLMTLATAAFALLVVSAFNYVTLSLARSLRRRREVAVRKVLGADQGALVRHYISESAIVTAISLGIGFLLAQLLHPWFARIIGQPETLFDLFDPVFLALSLTVFAVLALAVGAYPAFYLASTRPRTALGEGGAASPGRIGQLVTGGLMGLQISAATGLLIVAMTMAAQSNYIETRSLGYEVKDRYQVIIPCGFNQRASPAEAQRMMTLCQSAAKQVLGQMKDIPKPAYFNGAIMAENVTLQPFGRSAAGEKMGEAARLQVDTDFLQGMGAKLLAGRFFDSASAYDRALTDYSASIQARSTTQMMTDGGGRTVIMSSFDEKSPGPKRPDRVPVIVTRAMLPLLGADTPDKAIGMQISSQPNAQYPFEIVGVVEDWNQRPLKYAVHPIMFVPSTASNAVIEVARDSVDDVRERILQTWKTLAGSTAAANVQLRPLQQTLEQSYRSDFQLMSAVTSFALVAIVVAGMGVFGLSAFEMRRRVREIGIRKALGASPFAVAGLAIGRALAFAAIASIIAWPVGFWIANAWLSTFVYRTSLGWAVLPLASVIVVGFVGLAVAFSAVRAAAVRPGMALRV